MTTTFVSTSIPYVNAPPHVGFALELVQADVLARSRRQQGDDVFFLTGTDENALKNVQVAQDLGLTPRALCDLNAPAFELLATALNASVNGFIRTSTPEHHTGARQLWEACRQEDIFRKAYQGIYCVGCEDFYTESELTDGRCSIHGTVPEPVSEENWFFDLARYQQALDERLDGGGLTVAPSTRRNEALSFVRQGLRSFSISRSRTRTGDWGVEVPGDSDQTMYVWFDALANYVTGLGYGSAPADFERYWLSADERIHVIGKDILRFHAIQWPATLLSAGLPLPTAVCVHGFLTVNGEKISKSSGTAVDPIPIIKRYGADALRYYLLRVIPAGADGDYSEQKLREVYNADLANGLGNVVRRIETLCERSGYSECDRPQPGTPAEVLDSLSRFGFNEALESLWQRVGALNRAIEARRPWELLKTGQETALREALAGWVRETRIIAAGLSAFLPKAAKEIEASLSASSIRVGEPLFPRV